MLLRTASYDWTEAPSLGKANQDTEWLNPAWGLVHCGPRWGYQLQHSSVQPISVSVYLAMLALHSSGKITKNVIDSNFNLSSTLVNDVYLRHPLKAHEVN